jgi:hypothetical protein
MENTFIRYYRHRKTGKFFRGRISIRKQIVYLEVDDNLSPLVHSPEFIHENYYVVAENAAPIRLRYR